MSLISASIFELTISQLYKSLVSILHLWQNIIFLFIMINFFAALPESCAAASNIIQFKRTGRHLSNSLAL